MIYNVNLFVEKNAIESGEKWRQSLVHIGKKR
jgi:hypothetical protein